MKRVMLILAFLCFFLTPHDIFAQRGNISQGQPLEIKLASPMPANSDWGRALDRIAAEWGRVTNNAVRVRVLHNGTEGGDAKMLSSLSTNTIQAALFSSFGLSEICPAVMTLSVPFQIQNDAELDLVLKDILPVFESQIDKTKFTVVTWSKGGWVNVFSKDPVFTPDDLRRQRIATSPESEDLNTVFRTMGFHLVETEMSDIVTRSASGMITACYQTPAAIPVNSLHKALPHMLSEPLAPFMGAIVINQVSWSKISPDHQQAIMRVTQNIAAGFDTRMAQLVDDAIKAMGRDGLKINTPNPAQTALWTEEVQRALPSLLGTTFDRDLYYRIDGILKKNRGQ